MRLDYRTDNPRWGLSGMKFSNWENFSQTLGFLCNKQNHINNYISIVIEKNNKQGAWDKEGRIHYYKNLNSLQLNFIDLYNCRSAGNGNITCRINSNSYVYSLINDFNFIVKQRLGNLTADIYPPDNCQIAKNLLTTGLMNEGLDSQDINRCLSKFDFGYNL